MIKSEFNQGVTFKVFVHDHQRADGNNTVYLRVIIDRKKREFNLKITWPKEYFDIERQEAKPRYSKDKDVANVNMIINEAKGRANRIKMRYFSDSRSLTLDGFQKEFENYESRENFLFYWKTKQQYLLNRGLLTKQTIVRHNTNLNRFMEFAKAPVFFSMNDLKPDLMLQYQNWLRKKKKLEYNTSVNAMKVMLTYINHAIADGFKLENPFNNIPLRYRAGERHALERDELGRLRDYLGAGELYPLEKEILRKFLFSCYTGLRISDTSLISRDMINNGCLVLSPIKTIRFGKTITIPLPDYAMELVKGRTGLLFDSVSDQKCNMWLKVIAANEKVKITKRLTFRVSRDTFATIFIELGGDAFTLKEILGHSDIKTTQIYVKMSENRKAHLMSNFNSL